MLFRRHKVVWILIFALAVLSVLLTMAQSNMSSFRRFTSKPLPDGSRYTFLYPAFLKDVNEGSGGSPNVISSASVSNRGGEHPFDVNRTPWGTWARKAGFSQAEGVDIIVIPLKGNAVKDSRLNEELVLGWERRHNVYLVNARSKLKVQLFYSCARDAGQFKEHSRIIADSLRLLPPGAPIPAP